MDVTIIQTRTFNIRNLVCASFVLDVNISANPVKFYNYTLYVIPISLKISHTCKNINSTMEQFVLPTLSIGSLDKIIKLSY